MAGGAGVRFWPLSTDALPKQFMTAFSETSLYQSTVARARTLAPADRILVMTNATLVDLVRAQSPEIPAENVILEPARRDTAPALGLAAALVQRRWPGSVMAVLPSDHLVRDVEGFRTSLLLAAERATQGGLGTIGIHPSYPATGYGYLHVERGDRVRAVQRFVEKPDRARAETFLADGGYLWNAGIFIWQVERFMAELGRCLPDVHGGVLTIAEAWSTPRFGNVLNEVFTGLTRQSIDYGVMEKTRDVWTVTAAFDWNDIGGWTAAMDLVPSDASGNRTRGRIVLDRAHNNFVLATDPGHPVLCAGVQDSIIVATPNGTLVCHRDLADELKPMVEALLRPVPAPV
jgi:mannose-1-phosphate guanylyltransferase